MRYQKLLFGICLMFLGINLAYAQKSTFKEELTHLVQPLSVYSQELAVCSKPVTEFTKQNKNIKFGFYKELNLINHLVKSTNNYNINLQLVENNLHLSMPNANYEKGERYYHAVKDNLIKHGLVVTHENLNLKDSVVTIFKNPHLDTNENQLNAFISELDTVYHAAVNCYDLAFSDKFKTKALVSEDLSAIEKYRKLSQDFLEAYPLVESNGASLFHLMVYINNYPFQSHLYEKYKNDVYKEIDKYTSEQQIQLKEIFQIILDNPLSRPLYMGRNSQSEIYESYQQLHNWRLLQENRAKYYLRLK